ncbi:MAG: DciA family protein [Sulfuricaulis sp.]
MTRNGPKNAGAHLPSTMLKRAGVHMDKLSSLLTHWKSRVEEPLVSHSFPVSYDNGRLSLRADTSAWASRLRHDQARIMTTLRGDPYFQDLHELYVRVLPERARTAREKKPATISLPSRIPDTAAHLIKSVADDIIDPALRKALIRLAGAQDRRPQPKR